MRKLSADYIFNSHSSLLKRGILVLEDDGTIIDLIDTGGKLNEIANLEFYNGILIPGFVNCHAHLDLSWTRNSISMHTGLPGFIERMISTRRKMQANIQESASEANLDMFSNGISLVGDVCVSSDLFEIKSEGPVKYVNFIEVLDAGNSPTEILDRAVKLFNESQSHGIPAYLSPHSPYTVSSLLFRSLRTSTLSQVFSIHNQESADENLWFRGEKNPLRDMFTRHQLDADPYHLNGISSVQTISEYFPENSVILLIHNLATSPEDIDFVEKISGQIYWCFCPNSNLYISNRLPDFELFRSKNCNITLGTDSLGSNSSLSIWDEILTIHAFYPAIPLPELIKWGTINGAKALKMDAIYGSFEKGKKPGVILLQNIDLQTLLPTSSSSVKRLV
jgi:cytosine/adenosine deaminase-related metal-dependent hydrolase